MTTQATKTVPPAIPEYLAGIRAALKAQTDALAEKFGSDKWTDAQLDDYTNCGGWDDYQNYGYTPLDAVLEDMTYWGD